MYLPPIYNEELIYSWVGRYKEHTISTDREVINKLFASVNPFRISSFPKLTSQFQTNVKQLGISINSLIEDHTVYPYFQAFLSQKVSSDLLDYILCRGRSIASLRITNRGYLKFCPLCAESDISLYGETFWKTIHNVPHIHTCIVHKCYLVTQKTPNRIKIVTPNEIPYSRNQLKVNNNRDIEIFDTQLIDFLKGRAAFTKIELSELAIEKGFIKINTYKKRINSNQLTSFIKYVKSILLESITMDSSTIRKLCSEKHNGFYPELRILLRNFLLGVESKSKPVTIDINESDFICINSLCRNFQRTRTSILNGEKPVIKCMDCGMIYIYRFDRNPSILDVGDICIKEIGKLSNEGLTIGEIERKIEVSKYIIHSVLSKNYLRYDDQRIAKSKKIKRYRRKWKSELHSLGFESLKILREKFGEIYRYLRRHDSNWLNGANKKYWSKSGGIKSLEVYQKYDILYLAEIKSIYFELLQKKPEVRITNFAIFQRLGKRHYDYKNKLPQCNKFMSEISESYLEFKMRKIFNLHKEGLLTMPMNKSAIYKKFSVKNKAEVDQLVHGLSKKYGLHLVFN